VKEKNSNARSEKDALVLRYGKKHVINSRGYIFGIKRQHNHSLRKEFQRDIKSLEELRSCVDFSKLTESMKKAINKYKYPLDDRSVKGSINLSNERLDKLITHIKREDKVLSTLKGWAVLIGPGGQLVESGNDLWRLFKA